MSEPKLRGYAADIAKATGCTDAALLGEIEDTMRDTIFHSTLDWQTSRQFNKAAREALGLVLLQRRATTPAVLPVDTDIAKLLRVKPEDVPILRANIEAY